MIFTLNLAFRPHDFEISRNSPCTNNYFDSNNSILGYLKLNQHNFPPLPTDIILARKIFHHRHIRTGNMLGGRSFSYEPPNRLFRNDHQFEQNGEFLHAIYSWLEVERTTVLLVFSGGTGWDEFCYGGFVSTGE